MESRLREFPLALQATYQLYQISILDRKFVLVTFKGHTRQAMVANEDPVTASIPVTIEQLGKHLELIKTITGLTGVLVITGMEAYVRKRLIERKISFIIPFKQMYLPNLMIELREFGTRPQSQLATMAPATQLLLLYHLQKDSLEGKNFKVLADKFMLDNMTISRAAHYFHNTGLAKIEGTKEKYLKFEMSKQQLWEFALPFMTSPVKLIKYFSGWVLKESLKWTNISALAHYTSLNADPKEYYACKQVIMNFLPSVNLQPSNALEANIGVEVWKYDPYFLAEDGYVDKLSLYLSMRHHKDERIQIALDELMEIVKW